MALKDLRKKGFKYHHKKKYYWQREPSNYYTMNTKEHHVKIEVTFGVPKVSKITRLTITPRDWPNP